MIKQYISIGCIAILLVVTIFCSNSNAQSSSLETVLLIPSRSISGPAPMTGLVLWGDNAQMDKYSSAVALEFKYFRYDEVASGSPETGFIYDWTLVHQFLNQAAKRGHHGIVRFRDTDPKFSDPGSYPSPYLNQPGVPASVRGTVRKALYNEGIPGTNPVTVFFPDWSNPKLTDFVIDFFTNFSKEFDGKNSPLAYVQVGFGLWGEYHLDFENMSGFSDSTIVTIASALGKIFPSKSDQTRILNAINITFHDTPWGISIDSANGEYSSFVSHPEDKNLAFGLFDDSALCADPDGCNNANWLFFDKTPKTLNGGEISYYDVADQQNALSPTGPHGVSLAQFAKLRSLTYLVGNDQPTYRSPTEIAQAGKLMGYHFVIRSAYSTTTETVVTIENTGTAAVFFDIFPAMGSVRAGTSLRNLLPGATNARTYSIPAIGQGSEFSLQSDRLLSGQIIPFDGNK